MTNNEILYLVVSVVFVVGLVVGIELAARKMTDMFINEDDQD